MRKQRAHQTSEYSACDYSSDIISKAKITASGKNNGVENLVESGFVLHSAFTDREFTCEGDTAITVMFDSAPAASGFL